MQSPDMSVQQGRVAQPLNFRVAVPSRFFEGTGRVSIVSVKVAMTGGSRRFSPLWRATNIPGADVVRKTPDAC